jgi:YD repeat-containing protein
VTKGSRWWCPLAEKRGEWGSLFRGAARLKFECVGQPPYGTWGTRVNGNVDAWEASGTENFNRSYTYDSLNRLQSMTDSVQTQACQGLSWTIDSWGNMTAQTATAGSCYQFQVSMNNDNQFIGYYYDSAGNMTGDGVHSYTYDAESRLTQVDGGSTASYVYDANGRRVRKTTSSGWTEYLYGTDGRVQAEYNGTTWPVQYVYGDGKLVAEYTNGTTQFILSDHLGSTRLVTGMSQQVLDSMDYYPYGLQSAGASTTTHKFTGKERDAESGLDNWI